ncbi:hypothetical protein D8674_030840 [Pyrus ussuriensis x Pyrus communis]|uniref:Uncharacterized protein n=1 Tax=Pyrus ussuriensis x Pyrus communis TaxID=2448454 RepID=A0A5N5F2H4_9ROSA|nr:hypothetical protein D8674_030840 [Pyrus ussuriensis x Pyrus communis]
MWQPLQTSVDDDEDATMTVFFFADVAVCIRILEKDYGEVEGVGNVAMAAVDPFLI